VKPEGWLRLYTSCATPRLWVALPTVPYDGGLSDRKVGRPDTVARAWLVFNTFGTTIPTSRLQPSFSIKLRHNLFSWKSVVKQTRQRAVKPRNRIQFLAGQKDLSVFQIAQTISGADGDSISNGTERFWHPREDDPLGHLVPRLRTRGAATSSALHVFMVWYLIKHSDFQQCIRDITEG